MKIACFFGFHKWKKFGGLSNIGNAKFEQKYVCNECGKIKSEYK